MSDVHSQPVHCVIQIEKSKAGEKVHVLQESGSKEESGKVTLQLQGQRKLKLVQMFGDEVSSDMKELGHIDGIKVMNNASSTDIIKVKKEPVSPSKAASSSTEGSSASSSKGEKEAGMTDEDLLSGLVDMQQITRKDVRIIGKTITGEEIKVEKSTTTDSTNVPSKPTESMTNSKKSFDTRTAGSDSTDGLLSTIRWEGNADAGKEVRVKSEPVDDPGVVKVKSEPVDDSSNSVSSHVATSASDKIKTEVPLFPTSSGDSGLHVSLQSDDGSGINNTGVPVAPSCSEQQGKLTSPKSNRNESSKEKQTARKSTTKTGKSTNKSLLSAGSMVDAYLTGIRESLDMQVAFRKVEEQSKKKQREAEELQEGIEKAKRIEEQIKERARRAVLRQMEQEKIEAEKIKNAKKIKNVGHFTRSKVVTVSEANSNLSHPHRTIYVDHVILGQQEQAEKKLTPHQKHDNKRKERKEKQLQIIERAKTKVLKEMEQERQEAEKQNKKQSKNKQSLEDQQGRLQGEVHPQDQSVFVAGQVTHQGFAAPIPDLQNLFGEVPPIQGQVPPIQGQVPPIQGQVPSMQGQVPPMQGQVPSVQSQVPSVQGQLPLQGQPLHTGGQMFQQTQNQTHSMQLQISMQIQQQQQQSVSVSSERTENQGLQPQGQVMPQQQTVPGQVDPFAVYNIQYMRAMNAAVEQFIQQRPPTLVSSTQQSGQLPRSNPGMMASQSTPSVFNSQGTTQNAASLVANSAMPYTKRMNAAIEQLLKETISGSRGLSQNVQMTNPNRNTAPLPILPILQGPSSRPSSRMPHLAGMRPYMHPAMLGMNSQQRQWLDQRTRELLSSDQPAQQQQSRNNSQSHSAISASFSQNPTTTRTQSQSAGGNYTIRNPLHFQPQITQSSTAVLPHHLPSLTANAGQVSTSSLTSQLVDEHFALSLPAVNPAVRMTAAGLKQLHPPATTFSIPPKPRLSTSTTASNQPNIEPTSSAPRLSTSVTTSIRPDIELTSSEPRISTSALASTPQLMSSATTSNPSNLPSDPQPSTSAGKPEQQTAGDSGKGNEKMKSLFLRKESVEKLKFIMSAMATEMKTVRETTKKIAEEKEKTESGGQQEKDEKRDEGTGEGHADEASMLQDYYKDNP